MPLIIRGYALFLRVAEGPDFITLDALAGQVTQGLVLVVGAGDIHVH